MYEINDDGTVNQTDRGMRWRQQAKRLEVTPLARMLIAGGEEPTALIAGGEEPTDEPQNPPPPPAVPRSDPEQPRQHSRSPHGAPIINGG